MRRILILAATTAMLAVVAAPAHAALNETLSASILPAKAGTKNRPVKGNMLMRASISDPAGARLPVTDRVLIELDKNVVLNGKYFPSCTASKLDTSADVNLPSCRTAKVGAAVASAQLFDAQTNQLSGTINFAITIFNGPQGKSIIAFVEVPGTSVKKAMVGKITRSSSPYGLLISLVIPAELKQPLPGVFPSLNNLRITKFSATTATAKRIKTGTRTVRRKVGFLETIGCTGGKFNYRVGFDFTPPAPTIRKTATSTCRK